MNLTTSFLHLGIYVCLLGVAGGHVLKHRDYKERDDVGKVVVREVRFGVCGHGSVRDSAAANDPPLWRNSRPSNVTNRGRSNNRDTFKKRKTEGSDERKNMLLINKIAASRVCPNRTDLPSIPIRPNNEPENMGVPESLPRPRIKEVPKWKHDIALDDPPRMKDHPEWANGSPPQNKEDSANGDTETASVPEVKIVGGEMSLTSWPYLASIQYLGTDMEWHHFCGGSLIQAHWVITAAHCVMHIQDYYIRVVLGDYQLSKFSHREQVLNPDRIFRHASFNESTYHYDMAMIKLEGDVRMSKYVSTVEVATDDEVDRLDSTDTCYIAGWGNVVGTTTESYLSDHLRQSQMWVMPQANCQTWVYTTLLDSEICVFSQDSSACKGDSGGPLMCQVGDEWLLVGSASFIVSPTCEPQRPNVFTRVSNYVLWMMGVIRQYDPSLDNV